jgi:UDP-N-acetylmuramate dehydrogenase
MTTHPGARSILGDADRAALAAAGAGELLFDEPMARHTTLRIGGPADAWYTPGSIEQLRGVLSLCAERRIPVQAVGAGSNLLVRDGGIRGLVVATRKLRELTRVDDTRLRVQAGVSTGKVLAMATQWQLGGVEFLGGVPGSVGGGLIMNAGTYIGEFKDVTTAVRSVRLADAALIERGATDCAFVYRGSALPRDEVVVEADLTLFPRDRALIEADVRGLKDRRREREPKGVGNAGSIFKNPPGDFAGRLIEACGLKGRRIGAAECSPVHANWLVNTGDATARDLLALIDLVRSEVHRVHGIELQLEVKILGED